MSCNRIAYSFVIGCLVAGSALAQNNTATGEATEYGARPPHPPRIDFKGMGISREQAEQVKEILREGREYGASRETVRAQLSGVLNQSQLSALDAAMEARRAQGAGGQQGHAHPSKTGGGAMAAPQGARPAPRGRSGS